jgi:hypothetical protein
MFRIIYLKLIFALLLTSSGLGRQIDTLTVLTKKEFTFISDSIYQNPHIEVELNIIFSGPNGESITQGGYWDGGAIFKVRFAAPSQGMWSFETFSTDIDNEGLHEVDGSFFVKEYNGSEEFKYRGWLKVSDSGRYLTYGDGTPFFYLGDTAWEMGWKSTTAQLKEYISDRKSKGFSVIHTVPLSHQYLSNNGRRNRDGEDFFIDEDYSKINPRYFDHIDEIVDSVNSNGMILAMVPLWGWLNELHHRPDWGDNYINVEDSKLMARYMAARYAADNVVWIIGGDDRYDTDERRSFWDSFARIIKNASGWRQLATVHPRGWSASFDYFEPDTEWIDFQMYQSSHLVSAYYVYRTGRRGYDLEPVKPVINGEPNYEDIFNDLKNPGDEGAFRVKPEHVREAAYQSILSGATMGINYGANGVWQWSTLVNPGSHYARDVVMDAINYPGSDQMKVLKDIMIEYDWYDLKPNQEYTSIEFSEKVIISGVNSDHIISYLPMNLNTDVNYILPKDLIITDQRFINPITGLEVEIDNSVLGNKFSITPPDTTDWLFVANIEREVVEEPTNVQLYQNYPNPFNPNTVIEYYLNESSKVTLTIYDSIGREIRNIVNEVQQQGFHVASFNAQDLSSGIYFYRLTTDGYTTTKRMTLVK